MLAGEVHDLRNFRLRHLVSVDPANTDPFLMDVHHDPIGFLMWFVEEPLKDVNDEFHRRVIVVEQEHLVEARPFRFWLGFCNNTATQVSIIAVIVLFGHQHLEHGSVPAPWTIRAPAMFAALPHDSIAMMLPEFKTFRRAASGKSRFR